MAEKSMVERSLVDVYYTNSISMLTSWFTIEGSTKEAKVLLILS